MARESRGVTRGNGVSYVPLYCVNCGVRGPDAINGDQPGVGAAWICDARQNGCAEKWSPQFGQMLLSEAVYYELQRQEQIETLGHEITAAEAVEIANDGNHTLVKLARDLPGG